MRGLAFGALLATAAILPIGALAQGEAQPAPGPQPGKPANLCQELVAFVQQPAATQAAAAPSPQTATAVQAPAPQGAPPAAQPSAAAGEPQQKSGLSGPITATGPTPGPAQTPAQAPAAQAPAAAPPAAPAAPAAPKPSAEAVAQVETAARNNDTLACRAAAQQMRRAGVALPSPLLALSALDPKYFEPAQ